jgi:uncharacterized repeat protein (TIGR04042 family)
MPEMTFSVRWPDGRVDHCYSPSLVMHDHLSAGSRYAVWDFVNRSVEALDLAAERVRASYGFACTSAMATSEHIRAISARFGQDEPVEVLRMSPAPPEEESA